MKRLDGIKVIDLTQAVAGPYATALLSYLGADIIKLEPPGGDHFRYPMAEGSLFVFSNFNKKSICVDLKKERGKEIFQKLLEDGDVVIENFGPGVMDKLGFPYQKMKEINPQIVYSSIKGFGKGPYENYPAYDPAVQSLSGVVDMTGRPDEKPVRCGISVLDLGIGIMAAFLTVLSLADREKNGEGEKIEVTLFDLASSWMGYRMAQFSLSGKKPQRAGSGFEGLAPYKIYETKDDELFFLGILSERQWNIFCEEMNLQDLKDDPKFESVDKRWKNKEELDAIISNEFGKYSREELVEKLIEKIPCAPVKSVAELPDDPHLNERDMIVNTYRPEDGKECKTSGPPFQEGEIRSHPPKLGEDTDKILKDLGYSSEKIEELYKEEVVK